MLLSRHNTFCALIILIMASGALADEGNIEFEELSDAGTLFIPLPKNVDFDPFDCALSLSFNSVQDRSQTKGINLFYYPEKNGFYAELSADEKTGFPQGDTFLSVNGLDDNVACSISLNSLEAPALDINAMGWQINGINFETTQSKYLNVLLDFHQNTSVINLLVPSEPISNVNWTSGNFANTVNFKILPELISQLAYYEEQDIQLIYNTREGLTYKIVNFADAAKSETLQSTLQEASRGLVGLDAADYKPKVYSNPNFSRSKGKPLVITDVDGFAFCRVHQPEYEVNYISLSSLNDMECQDQLKNISELDVTAMSNHDAKSLKYATSGLVQRLYADLEHVTSEVVPTNSTAIRSDAETRSSEEFLKLELEVKQLQNKIDQLVSENMMLVSALTDAENKELATEAQIQDLGNRLNAALARAAVEERKRRNEDSTKINRLSDELAETKQQLKIATRSLEQEKRYHQSAKAKQKNLESQLNLARISSENNREIISTLRNDLRKLEEEKISLKSKIIDGPTDKNKAADQDVMLAAALARQVQLELQLEALDRLLNDANIREERQLTELSDLQSDLARALFDLEKLREAMERQRARAEQRIAVLEDAIAQLSQPSETAQKELQELTKRLNAALEQAAAAEQKRKDLEMKYEAELADALETPQKDIPSKKLDIRPKLRPLNMELVTNGGSDDTNLEAILKQVTQPNSSTTNDVSEISGPPLTGGEMHAFRNQVANCWSVNVGSRAANVSVTIAMEMQPDGKVVASSLEMTGFEGGNQSDANVAFQAARRAILRCQKNGYDLPKEKYARWKNMEITFDPNSMRKR